MNKTVSHNAQLQLLLPWVEKYRPNKIADVVQPKSITNILDSAVKTKNLPHFLFYGPAGVGKTSAILSLCKQLFGSNEVLKTRVLELNASNDRGIDVVRDKIKTFAQSRPVFCADIAVPNFKVIILDEADNMTPDAQFALRRLMEEYCATTRFCILCNYLSRIIPPLISRCIVLRFRALQPSAVEARLQTICILENVKIQSDSTSCFFTTLISLSSGDLRGAISLLQSVAQSFTVEANEDGLTNDHLNALADTIPDEYFEEIVFRLNNICGGVSASVTSVSPIYDLAQTVSRDGYMVQKFLTRLATYLVYPPLSSACVHWTLAQKCQIVIALAQCEAHCVQGGDELLQLLELFATIVDTLLVIKAH